MKEVEEFKASEALAGGFCHDFCCACLLLLFVAFDFVRASLTKILQLNDTKKIRPSSQRRRQKRGSELKNKKRGILP